MAEKKNILLVDDDDMVQMVMPIRVPGANFDPAVTIAEATEKLAKNKYDAVVMDYSMPEGNTEALVRATKAKQPGLLIIAGSDTQKSNDALAALGCVPNTGGKNGAVELATTLVEKGLPAPAAPAKVEGPRGGGSGTKGFRPRF